MKTGRDAGHNGRIGHRAKTAARGAACGRRPARAGGAGLRGPGAASGRRPARPAVAACGLRGRGAACANRLV